MADNFEAPPLDAELDAVLRRLKDKGVHYVVFLFYEEAAQIALSMPPLDGIPTARKILEKIEEDLHRARGRLDA